jgi:hypothetical protein
MLVAAMKEVRRGDLRKHRKSKAPLKIRKSDN